MRGARNVAFKDVTLAMFFGLHVNVTWHLAGLRSAQLQSEQLVVVI